MVIMRAVPSCRAPKQPSDIARVAVTAEVTLAARRTYIRRGSSPHFKAFGTSELRSVACYYLTGTKARIVDNAADVTENNKVVSSEIDENTRPLLAIVLVSIDVAHDRDSHRRAVDFDSCIMAHP